MLSKLLLRFVWGIVILAVVSTVTYDVAIYAGASDDHAYLASLLAFFLVVALVVMPWTVRGFRGEK